MRRTGPIEPKRLAGPTRQEQADQPLRTAGARCCAPGVAWQPSRPQLTGHGTAGLQAASDCAPGAGAGGHGWRMVGRGLITGGFLLCGWLVTGAGHAYAAQITAPPAPHQILTGQFPVAPRPASAPLALPSFPGSAGAGAGNQDPAVRNASPVSLTSLPPASGSSASASVRPAGSEPAVSVPMATGAPTAVAPAGTAPAALGVRTGTEPARPAVSPPAAGTAPAGSAPGTAAAPADSAPAAVSVPAGSAPVSVSVPAGSAPVSVSVPAGSAPVSVSVAAGGQPAGAAAPTGSVPAAGAAGLPASAGSPASIPAGSVISGGASLLSGGASLLSRLGAPVAQGQTPSVGPMLPAGPSLPAPVPVPQTGRIQTLPMITAVPPAGRHARTPVHPRGGGRRAVHTARSASVSRSPAGFPAMAAAPLANRSHGDRDRARAAAARHRAHPRRSLPGDRLAPGVATQTDPTSTSAGGAGAPQVAAHAPPGTATPVRAVGLIRIRTSRCPGLRPRAEEPAVSPD